MNNFPIPINLSINTIPTAISSKKYDNPANIPAINIEVSACVNEIGIIRFIIHEEAVMAVAIDVKVVNNANGLTLNV